jgi:hypothetical protein
MLLNGFQALGILYSSLDSTNWHSGYANWLEQFCDAILLRRVLFGSTAALYGFFATLLVFWLLLGSVYLVKRTAQYSEWSGILSRLSNLLMALITTLYLPLSSLFGSIASCQQLEEQTGQLVKLTVCWSDTRLVSFIIALVAYMLLMAAVTVKNLLMSEPCAFRSFWMSKSYGRIDALESLALSALVFIQSALFDTMNSNSLAWWVYRLFVVGITSWIAISNYRYLPYYHTFCRVGQLRYPYFYFGSQPAATKVKSISCRKYQPS